MGLATEKVLSKLNVKVFKGVTFADFPNGFRLAARIYDLRKSGYEIVARPGSVTTYILKHPPLPGFF